jgi:hypothetical protein
LEKLCAVGRRVRDLYPASDPERMLRRVNDDIIRAVATDIAGQLGGKTGLAPRAYLRKLVELLDKVEEHESFDPLRHANLKLDASALTEPERAAAGLTPSLDDIDLHGDGPSRPESDL